MPTPEDRHNARAAQRLAWMEPPLPPVSGEPAPPLFLPPRRVHVQASADGAHPLGHVPWDEHRLACQRLNKDP